MGCCKFPFLIRKKKKYTKDRRAVISINLVSVVIVVGLLVTIPLATQLLVLLSTVAYVLYDDWTVKQCFVFCSVPAGIFCASAKFGAMDPPIMFCSKCRTVLV